MPDYILHTEIGEELIGGFRSPIQDMIQQYHNEYILGLQGPDLFFYRAFFPGKNKKLSRILAQALHKRDFSVYSYLILNGLKYFPEPEEKEKIFSYFLGFFAHLFLDLFLHPYVIYKTDFYKTTYPMLWLHKRIEMNIDYAYVSLKRGEFSPLYYVNKFEKIGRFPREVSLFFSKVVRETYNLDFPSCCVISNFNQAYRKMRFTLVFFETKDPLKRYIIHPLLYIILAGGRYINFLTHPMKEEFEDILNLEHTPWIHPVLNKRYTFSVIDLIEEFMIFCKRVSGSMYDFVYENGSYPKELEKDYSFSKGVIYEGKGFSWIL